MIVHHSFTNPGARNSSSLNHSTHFQTPPNYYSFCHIKPKHPPAHLPALHMVFTPRYTLQPRLLQGLVPPASASSAAQVAATCKAQKDQAKNLSLVIPITPLSFFKIPNTKHLRQIVYIKQIH